MALIEHDLFRGRIDRVQIAIDRLKMFEPEEGYYLAYSGGKDSDTILTLAKMAGVKFDAHYHLTTVDPPELVYHVRRHPEVRIERPEMSMWQLIRKKGILPTRVTRYCCAYLKERGGSGRVVLTGVRSGESIKRSKRKMNEVCYTDPSKRFLHAIVDWGDKEVWQFIREYNVIYCKLYDQGSTRLGCILCPLATQKERKKQAKKYPKVVTAYRHAIKLAFYARELAIVGTSRKQSTFKDGDDQFDCWMSGRSVKEWAEKDTSFWAYE